MLPSEQIRQRIRRESLASTDYAGCGIERDVFLRRITSSTCGWRIFGNYTSRYFDFTEGEIVLWVYGISYKTKFLA